MGANNQVPMHEVEVAVKARDVNTLLYQHLGISGVHNCCGASFVYGLYGTKDSNPYPSTTDVLKKKLDRATFAIINAKQMKDSDIVKSLETVEMRPVLNFPSQHAGSGYCVLWASAHVEDLGKGDKAVERLTEQLRVTRFDRDVLVENIKTEAAEAVRQRNEAREEVARLNKLLTAAKPLRKKLAAKKPTLGLKRSRGVKGNKPSR